MGKQIHKRLPEDFIEDVIRTFCDKGIGEEQAKKDLVDRSIETVSELKEF